ncbi:FkbM family methyltransferase [Paramaledivibacter caminithermalis]|nr:FkbM family methyltransferase [Paramaledivibacter caminithermalis]
MEADSVVSTLVKTYSSEYNDRIFSIKSLDYSDNDRIVIMGASATGEKAFKYLQDKNVKVSYFTDNDNSKWGNIFCGLEVIPPNDLNCFKEEITIVIACSNFHGIWSIANQILSNHNIKKIYVYDIFLLNKISHLSSIKFAFDYFTAFDIINPNKYYTDSFFQTLRETPVVLFGVNEEGKMALDFFTAMNIDVKYFIDNHKERWDSEFCGKKIISIEEATKLGEDLTIIICEPNSEDKIEKFNVVVNLEQYIDGYKSRKFFCFKDLLTGDYARFNFKYFYDNASYLESLMDILVDKKSKKVLANIIKARLTYDFSFYKEALDLESLRFKNLEFNDSYFYSNILQLSENETFIDVGASWGDTTLSFINSVNYKFKKVHIFEPDNESAEIITSIISGNLSKKENEILETFNVLSIADNIVKKKLESQIVLHKLGLYSKNAVLKFNGDKGPQSAINNDGNIEIKVVRLDDYLKDEEVTLIKMDIEGAEMDALRGAENIIKKYKPKLAISVYHRDDDLWKIPLYLKSLVPEYKLYLRHYSSYSAETVCYATL